MAEPATKTQRHPAAVEAAAAPPAKPRGGAGLFSLYRALGHDAQDTGLRSSGVSSEGSMNGTPTGGTPVLRIKGGGGEPARSQDDTPLAPKRPALSRAAQMLSDHESSVQANKFQENNTSPQGAQALKPPPDTSRALDAGQVASGANIPAEAFPNHTQARDTRALAEAAAAAVTVQEPGAKSQEPSLRHSRRTRRSGEARNLRAERVYAGVDSRLIEARQKKQLKRRVRGEDYEQVTVIMDRALYVALDERLAKFSAGTGGSVKLSRSIFVRALLKRFLNDAVSKHKNLSFDGLFTPDPRAPEELEVIEAALVERLDPGLIS